MASVVTESCVNCKYTDCVVVCPADCFYQDEKQLYIDPENCICCEACLTECPAEAIYNDDNVPPKWQSYVQLNKSRTQELIQLGTAPITEKQDPMGRNPTP